jgi:hypothetical protein
MGSPRASSKLPPPTQSVATATSWDLDDGAFKVEADDRSLSIVLAGHSFLYCLSPI